MFTGIITHVSSIKKAQKTGKGLLITFNRPSDWNDLSLGESIAVNGVCLTVERLRNHEYDCLLMPETLAKTSFDNQIPEKVNLERALAVQDRFGGHFVQGHIDGQGLVTEVDQVNGYRLTIQFDPSNRGLVIYKGSIAINGVSLTVAEVKDNCLQVALVPYTLRSTTLKSLRVGDQVNLEFDVLGKYVVNNMRTNKNHATS